MEFDVSCRLSLCRSWSSPLLLPLASPLPLLLPQRHPQRSENQSQCKALPPPLQVFALALGHASWMCQYPLLCPHSLVLPLMTAWAHSIGTGSHCCLCCRQAGLEIWDVQMIQIHDGHWLKCSLLNMLRVTACFHVHVADVLQVYGWHKL